MTDVASLFREVTSVSLVLGLEDFHGPMHYDFRCVNRLSPAVAVGPN